MLHTSPSARTRAIALAAVAAFALSACTTAYTGPLEVTRFVADQPSGLGQGMIALRFSPDIKNKNAIAAFRAAIGDELALLGYTIVDNEEIAGQIARIDTSRDPIDQGTRRSPVSVGVGGSTGSYGSGLGVGIGFDLGGGSQSPRVLSQLSIAIVTNPRAGEGASEGEDEGEGQSRNLWEARAQFPTSVDSPFAPVEKNARALAAAVFRDFPGGNGETITIEVSDLVEDK